MARCKGCGRERVKYRGTLAKPILKSDVLAAAVRSYKNYALFLAERGDATQARLFDFRHEIQLQSEKLPALAEHYGVDLSKPLDRLGLVYFLAVDHVPGFRVKHGRGRGRPLKNDDLKRKKLREEVRRKGASDLEVKNLVEEIEARKAQGQKVTAKEVIAVALRDVPAKERNRLIKAMEKKVSKGRVANRNRKTREK